MATYNVITMVNTSEKKPKPSIVVKEKIADKSEAIKIAEEYYNEHKVHCEVIRNPSTIYQTTANITNVEVFEF